MALEPCGRWLYRIHMLVLVAGLASSLATNRTIDDEKGDSVTGAVPSYSPARPWNQGATCKNCAIHLDYSQTFDGTWHDSTRFSNGLEPHVITANFTGTAVYVYNIIVDIIPFNTNLRFTLDGTVASKLFSHVATGFMDPQYNVLVFESTGLPNTDHTLAIEAISDKNLSLVLFDRIVYTFEEILETPHPGPSPPALPSFSASPTSPTVNTSLAVSISQGTSATANIWSAPLTGSQIPPESFLSVSIPPIPSRGTETIPSFSTPFLIPSNSKSPTLNTSPTPPPTRSINEIPTSSPSNVAVHVPPLSVHPSMSPTTLAGEIASGVVVALLATIIAFCLLRHRHKTRTRTLAVAVDPARDDSQTYTDGTEAATVAAPGAIARVDPDTIGSVTAHSYSRPASVGTSSNYLPRPVPVRSVAVPLDSGANEARLLSAVYPSSFSWRHTLLNPELTSSTLSLPRSSHDDTGPHSSLLSSITDEKLAPGDNPSEIPGNYDAEPSSVPQTPAVPASRSSESEGVPSRAGARLTLRAQVAALQQEVERLREQQELQHFQFGSDMMLPPRYDEAP